MTRPFLSPWIILPLVFNLVVILGAWIYYTNRRAWSSRATSPRQLFRCGSCGHVYVVSQEYPTMQCPKCGRDNEVVKR